MSDFRVVDTMASGLLVLSKIRDDVEGATVYVATVNGAVAIAAVRDAKVQP